MRYKTEKDFLDLVENFENGRIPRSEWDHVGHLTVALYYIFYDGLETAINKMRHNLLNHLKLIGVDFTMEMPYHETLTIFWMQTINDFKNTKNCHSVVEIGNELVEKFDKDFPLRVYSRELLFSEAARAKFVEPDLIKTEE